MNKLLLALTALPFMAGAAVASQPQPLNDRQMDKVTAGFTAISIADAEGLVGRAGTLLTTTASVSQVIPYAVATPTVAGVVSEFSSTLFKSVAAAQSSSVTGTIPLQAVPGLSVAPGP
jgi:hypothetical protein